MNMAKRIGLFLGVNLLIVLTITTVTSLLGIQPYLSSRGINLQALAVFCLLWGFGGAFISLAISRMTAKWMMGVHVIDPMTRDSNERWLIDKLADRPGDDSRKEHHEGVHHALHQCHSYHVAIGDMGDFMAENALCLIAIHAPQ